MKTSNILFMVVGLGLTTCAPPTAPTRPSWDVDVFPILQGSCNHCHGETVGKLPNQPLGRLDLCQLKPFMDAGIPVSPTVLGAYVDGGLFANNLRPLSPGARPQMPPPPASLLSEYERDVLIRWAMNPDMDKCQKQGRNREPEMKFIGDPDWNGNDVTMLIEVWDPDKDQVLGKVNVGNVSEFIPGAGRREITVRGANPNDPITVLLHDGYVSRTVEP